MNGKKQLKQLKIIHLISTSGLYGAEKVVLNLCLGLKKAGFAPVIVTLTDPAAGYKELMNAAKIMDLDFVAVPCAGKFDLKAFSRLKKVISDQQADIVHTHGYKADLYGLFAVRGMKIKLAATCHNWLEGDLFLRFYQWLDKKVLRRVGSIAAVSAVIAGELEAAGISRDKIKIIPNGIDLDSFRDIDPTGSKAKRAEFNISAEDRVLITVGRLSSEKGLDILLEAAAAIKDKFPDFKILLTGDGPLAETLKALAGKLGLGNKVIFAGRREDVAGLLAAADIFVLPSLIEGMPVSLLEAMAAKVPVIASAVGEIPAIIENGVSGILCTPGDKEDLSKSLLLLLTNAEKGRELADKALSTVTAKYSLDTMTRQYTKLYLGQG
jgi:glycosyltransferase involved in cell wall biosynthesis